MSVKILVGDVLERLAELSDESVHCVVTSPPYWGLRDYGVSGQLGLEPTLGEHLEIMVKVFAGVRRVMRPDATLWLNYGDCYATSVNGKTHLQDDARVRSPNDDRTFTDKPMSTVGGVLKPKDLCMIPNRLAIALQEDGWWVRSEIIWAKPNPMPESVQDRPTSAHEKIWLLSKSQRYYYDADAVRTKLAPKTLTTEGTVRAQIEDDGSGKVKKANMGGMVRKPDPRGANLKNVWHDKQSGHSRRHAGFNERWDQMTPDEQQALGANLRNVWDIATKPFPDAHFATFPPQLAEACIKAGCPEGGTVLDPFGGSGTTGLVADRLKRDAILIELNPEYAAMAERRIKGDAPLFTEVAAQ